MLWVHQGVWSLVSISARAVDFVIRFLVGCWKKYRSAFQLLLLYLVGEDLRQFPHDSFPWSNRNLCCFYKSLPQLFLLCCCIGRTLEQLHLLLFQLKFSSRHISFETWMCRICCIDHDESYRPVMTCEYDRNSLRTSKGLSYAAGRPILKILVTCFHCFFSGFPLFFSVGFKRFRTIIPHPNGCYPTPVLKPIPSFPSLSGASSMVLSDVGELHFRKFSVHFYCSRNL